MSVRQAAAQTGVADALIRKWIKDGKQGRKLQTYYEPDELETALVSRESVLAFARIKTRSKTHRILDGAFTIRLNEIDAQAVRTLAKLMTERVGVPISYAEAVRGAVTQTIRLEEARAAARRQTP